MSDLLETLLRLNLAAGAAVALVMALRLPVRRRFGPGVAYGLWSLVPLAALAMLAPARVVTVVEAAWPLAAGPMDRSAAMTAALPLAHAAGPGPLLVAAWLAGVAASLLWLARRQMQFVEAVRGGRAGPAVIGVLRPRVVIPDDFAARYTAREQEVILAHEQSHIARQDARINAATALARCLGWFNPLAYVASHYLRIDQELACDGRVIAAYPSARRSYAEAMLKTQLARHPLPLGCYWPPGSVHPLAERISLLSRRAPGRAQRWAGSALVVILGLGGGLSAWAARPAQIVWASAKPAVVAAMPHESAPVPAPSRSPDAKPVSRPSAAPVAIAAAPKAGWGPPQPLAVQQVVDDGPPPWAHIGKIHSVARRSAVEPGSAVRVLATMTDRDGLPLVTDMTAYGSQQEYRTGYFTRKGSRYSLFTAVAQHGDRLWVTASLDSRFRPENSGSISLAAGQTGTITLGDGQQVTVTPSVRAETREEVEDGEREVDRRSARNVLRGRGLWDAVFP